MNDLAIRADGLGKRFKIGAKPQGYKTLAESLVEAAVSPLRRLAGRRSGEEAGADQFWALKDVSFDIRRGEVVGIVGKNGAGKSTLLKLLAQITQPTAGRGEVRGRVGSLLEVGTGFHPELTGRENTYLNGAILGMKRSEITRNLDAIIEFAEVEKFIDTPVKHYSSGMYLRLAFAVAAHLETEILLVDEVLAVGDASFQKKCLGKMEDTAQHGRTVLFVSHNMGAVTGLCSRAIWIDSGTVRGDGPATQVVAEYLDSLSTSGDLQRVLTPMGDLEVSRVELKGDDGVPRTEFQFGDPLVVDIHYRARKPVERPGFWLGVYNQRGGIFGCSMLMDGCRPEVLTGEGVVRCRFSRMPLMPNTYTLGMGARDRFDAILLKTGDVASFRVVGTAKDLGLDGDVADAYIQVGSPVHVPYEWEFEGESPRRIDLFKTCTPAALSSR